MLDAALTIAVCGDAADSVDECLATAPGRGRGRHCIPPRAGARRRRGDAVPDAAPGAPPRGAARAHRRPHGAADLARIAHHAEHAADGEAVLRYAPAAAEQATRLGAHREAAAQYARALSFAESLSPEEQASLHERRSDALYLTDDQVEAIAELDWRSNTTFERAARPRGGRPGPPRVVSHVSRPPRRGGGFRDPVDRRARRATGKRAPRRRDGGDGADRGVPRR